MNLKKFTTIITCMCFVFSFIISQPLEATLERIEDTKKAAHLFDTFTIPVSIGRITDAYRAQIPVGMAKDATVVINIQDLHCHAEVQRNIAKILALFDRNIPLDHVYVEGASGPVDTSWLAKIPDESIREKILVSLLESGKLTGAEYYSITSRKTDLLVGIENEQLHTANILRLNKILHSQGAIDRILKGLEERITRLEELYYARDNGSIEQLSKRYKQGDIKPDDYYTRLKKYADDLQIGLGAFENIRLFLDSTELNKNLKHKQGIQELQQFMAQLKLKLPYVVYDRLVTKTKNFSDANLLYFYLAKIADEYSMNLAAYPNLKDFFSYLQTSRALNPVDLIREEQRLISEIKLHEAKDLGQRDVVFLASYFVYLKDFLRSKISATDYEFVLSHLARFNTLYARYINAEDVARVKPYIELLTPYYQANLARNDCFLKNCGLFNPRSIHVSQQDDIVFQNTQSAHSVSNNGDIGDVLRNSAHIILLVTGGFHSSGIKQLLKKQNISYFVVTPTVTKETKSAEDVYNSLLNSQSEALESINTGNLNQVLTNSLQLKLLAESIRLRSENLEYAKLAAEAILEAGIKSGFDSEDIIKLINTWLAKEIKGVALGKIDKLTTKNPVKLYYEIKIMDKGQTNTYKYEFDIKEQVVHKVTDKNVPEEFHYSSSKIRELTEDLPAGSIILIGGPSSAGKTTITNEFTNDLFINMDRFKANLDNPEIPIDASGRKNYDTPEAYRIGALLTVLKKLIDGETVDLPVFDSGLGRVNAVEKVTLQPGQRIVIEGILVPIERIQKLYGDTRQVRSLFIQARNDLNDDTQERLLRRVFRGLASYASRAQSLNETLRYWNNVQQAEERYIFPDRNLYDYIIVNEILGERKRMLKEVYANLRYSLPVIDNENLPFAKGLLQYLENILKSNDRESAKLYEFQATLTHKETPYEYRVMREDEAEQIQPLIAKWTKTQRIPENLVPSLDDIKHIAKDTSKAILVGYLDGEPVSAVCMNVQAGAPATWEDNIYQAQWTARLFARFRAFVLKLLKKRVSTNLYCFWIASDPDKGLGYLTIDAAKEYVQALNSIRENKIDGIVAYSRAGGYEKAKNGPIAKEFYERYGKEFTLDTYLKLVVPRGESGKLLLRQVGAGTVKKEDYDIIFSVFEESLDDIPLNLLWNYWRNNQYVPLDATIAFHVNNALMSGAIPLIGIVPGSRGIDASAGASNVLVAYAPTDKVAAVFNGDIDIRYISNRLSQLCGAFMNSKILNRGTDIANVTKQRQDYSGATTLIYIDKKNNSNFYKLAADQHAFNDFVIKELLVLQKLKELKGIPKVLEFGLTDTLLVWVKMKGIRDAKSLGRRFTPLPDEWMGLSREEKIDVAIKVAKALQGMHEKGLLHNDIKPENILINKKKEVLLIDFGSLGRIGDLYEGSATPLYSAPERVDSDKKAGTYSDVFSLGVTLLELFTNQDLRKGLDGRGPVEFDFKDTDLGPLSSLIESMVAYDYRDRQPQTMHEVIARLQAIRKEILRERGSNFISRFMRDILSNIQIVMLRHLLVSRDAQEANINADVLLICGNDEIDTFKEAVRLLREHRVKKVLISAGYGWLTIPLLEAAAKNSYVIRSPKTGKVVSLKQVRNKEPGRIKEEFGLSEAEIIRQIMMSVARQENSAFDAGSIILEQESTNTMENFENAKPILESLRAELDLEAGAPVRVAYMHTPLQQYRTKLTFYQVFEHEIAQGSIKGISYTTAPRSGMAKDFIVERMIAEMWRLLLYTYDGGLPSAVESYGLANIRKMYWRAVFGLLAGYHGKDALRKRLFNLVLAFKQGGKEPFISKSDFLARLSTIPGYQLSPHEQKLIDWVYQEGSLGKTMLVPDAVPLPISGPLELNDEQKRKFPLVQGQYICHIPNAVEGGPELTIRYSVGFGEDEIGPTDYIDASIYVGDHKAYTAYIRFNGDTFYLSDYKPTSFDWTYGVWKSEEREKGITTTFYLWLVLLAKAANKTKITGKTPSLLLVRLSERFFAERIRVMDVDTPVDIPSYTYEELRRGASKSKESTPKRIGLFSASFLQGPVILRDRETNLDLGSVALERGEGDSYTIVSLKTYHQRFNRYSDLANVNEADIERIKQRFDALAQLEKQAGAQKITVSVDAEFNLKTGETLLGTLAQLSGNYELERSGTPKIPESLSLRVEKILSLVKTEATNKTIGGIWPWAQEWYVSYKAGKAEKSGKDVTVEQRIAWAQEYARNVAWWFENLLPILMGGIAGFLVFVFTNDVDSAVAFWQQIYILGWLDFLALHHDASRENKIAALTISALNIVLPITLRFLGIDNPLLLIILSSSLSAVIHRIINGLFGLYFGRYEASFNEVIRNLDDPNLHWETLNHAISFVLNDHGEIRNAQIEILISKLNKSMAEKGFFSITAPQRYLVASLIAKGKPGIINKFGEGNWSLFSETTTKGIKEYKSESFKLTGKWDIPYPQVMFFIYDEYAVESFKGISQSIVGAPKILLISTPEREVFVEEASKGKGEFREGQRKNPQIGLFQSAFTLKILGLTVDTYDINIKGLAGLQEEMGSFNPDVVSFNVNIVLSENDIKLIRKAREFAPKAFFVAGGTGASFRGTDLLRLTPLDGVIVGSGTTPLVEAATKTKKDSIRGLMLKGREKKYKKSLPITKAQFYVAKRIGDESYRSIDFDAPFPKPLDDHLPHIDYRPYWKYAEKIAKSIHPYSLDQDPLLSLHRSVRIVSELFCTRGCGYCAWTTWAMKNMYQGRQKPFFLKPNEMLRQVSMLLESYPKPDNIQFIWYINGDLSLPTTRALEEFCSLMIMEYGDEVPQWGGYIRPEVCSQELLALMHRAGCRQLFFAGENLTQRSWASLNRFVLIDKSVPPQDIITSAIDNATSVGIQPVVSFILMPPESKVSDILLTLEGVINANKKNAHTILFSAIEVRSGSEMSEMALSGAYEVENKVVDLGEGETIELPFRILPNSKVIQGLLKDLPAAYKEAELRYKKEVKWNNAYTIPQSIKSLLTILSLINLIIERSELIYDPNEEWPEEAREPPDSFEAFNAYLKSIRQKIENALEISFDFTKAKIQKAATIEELLPQINENTQVIVLASTNEVAQEWTQSLQNSGKELSIRRATAETISLLLHDGASVIISDSLTDLNRLLIDGDVYKEVTPFYIEDTTFAHLGTHFSDKGGIWPWAQKAYVSWREKVWQVKERRLHPLFGRIEGIVLDAKVTIRSMVFDVDTTLTVDATKPLTRKAKKQLIRALEADIPVLLISGSAYATEEKVLLYKSLDPADAVTEVLPCPYSIKTRIVRELLHEMDKRGTRKKIAHLQIMGFTGMEHVKFTDDAQDIYELRTDKLLSPVAQLEVGRALCVGYLEALQQTEHLDLAADIDQIKNAGNIIDIRRMFNDTIQRLSGEDFLYKPEMNIHNGEIVIDDHGQKKLDCTWALARAESQLRKRLDTRECGILYSSSGMDFLKYSLLNKADEVSSYLEEQEGDGITLAMGDSTADTFLWEIVGKKIVPVFLGAASVVHGYPRVLIGTKKGNDNIEEEGSGHFIKLFLDAMKSGTTYRVLDKKLGQGKLQLRASQAPKASEKQTAQWGEEYARNVAWWFENLLPILMGGVAGYLLFAFTNDLEASFLLWQQVYTLGWLDFLALHHDASRENKIAALIITVLNVALPFTFRLLSIENPLVIILASSLISTFIHKLISGLFGLFSARNKESFDTPIRELDDPNVHWETSNHAFTSIQDIDAVISNNEETFASFTQSIIAAKKSNHEMADAKVHGIIESFRHTAIGELVDGFDYLIYLNDGTEEIPYVIFTYGTFRYALKVLNTGSVVTNSISQLSETKSAKHAYEILNYSDFVAESRFMDGDTNKRYNLRSYSEKQFLDSMHKKQPFNYRGFNILVEEVAGRGDESVIYKVRNIDTGEVFALKVGCVDLSSVYLSWKKRFEEINKVSERDEVLPFLIEYKIGPDDDYNSIFMEYFPSRTFRSLYIDNFPENAHNLRSALQAIQKVLRVLKVLAKYNIPFGDAYARNILIGENGSLKIADPWQTDGYTTDTLMRRDIIHIGNALYMLATHKKLSLSKKHLEHFVSVIEHGYGIENAGEIYDAMPIEKSTSDLVWIALKACSVSSVSYEPSVLGFSNLEKDLEDFIKSLPNDRVINRLFIKIVSQIQKVTKRYVALIFNSIKYSSWVFSIEQLLPEMTNKTRGAYAEISNQLKRMPSNITLSAIDFGFDFKDLPRFGFWSNPTFIDSVIDTVKQRNGIRITKNIGGAVSFKEFMSIIETLEDLPAEWFLTEYSIENVKEHKTRISLFFMYNGVPFTIEVIVDSQNADINDFKSAITRLIPLTLKKIVVDPVSDRGWATIGALSKGITKQEIVDAANTDTMKNKKTIFLLGNPNGVANVRINVTEVMQSAGIDVSLYEIKKSKTFNSHGYLIPKDLSGPASGVDNIGGGIFKDGRIEDGIIGTPWIRARMLRQSLKLAYDDLTQQVDLSKVDVVFIDHYWPSALIDEIKKNYPAVQVICVFHTTTERSTEQFVNYLKGALKNADAVTFWDENLTPDKKPVYSLKGIVPTLVMPIGVNPASLHNIELSRMLIEAVLEKYSLYKPYILQIGRYDVYKNHLASVYSYAKMIENNPGVPYDLVLVGDEDFQNLLEPLRRYVNSFPENVRTRIHIIDTGDKSHFFTDKEKVALLADGFNLDKLSTQQLNWIEVNALQRGCMFGLLPSMVESQNTVTIEMGLKGKPVLGTRRGGFESQQIDSRFSVHFSRRDEILIRKAYQLLKSGKLQQVNDVLDKVGVVKDFTKQMAWLSNLPNNNYELFGIMIKNRMISHFSILSHVRNILKIVVHFLTGAYVFTDFSSVVKVDELVLPDSDVLQTKGGIWPWAQEGYVKWQERKWLKKQSEQIKEAPLALRQEWAQEYAHTIAPWMENLVPIILGFVLGGMSYMFFGGIIVPLVFWLTGYVLGWGIFTAAHYIKDSHGNRAPPFNRKMALSIAFTNAFIAFITVLSFLAAHALALIPLDSALLTAFVLVSTLSVLSVHIHWVVNNWLPSSDILPVHQGRLIEDDVRIMRETIQEGEKSFEGRSIFSSKVGAVIAYNGVIAARQYNSEKHQLHAEQLVLIDFLKKMLEDRIAEGGGPEHRLSVAELAALRYSLIDIEEESLSYISPAAYQALFEKANEVLGAVNLALGSPLEKCSLYITLAPCNKCTRMIKSLKVGRVLFSNRPVNSTHSDYLTLDNTTGPLLAKESEHLILGYEIIFVFSEWLDGFIPFFHFNFHDRVQVLRRYIQGLTSRTNIFRYISGVDMNAIVQLRAMVFDLDRTVTPDSVSPLDAGAKEEILRALMSDIPVFLVTESPFKEKQEVKLYKNKRGNEYDILTIPSDKGGPVEKRILEDITGELRKRGEIRKLANLRIRTFTDAEYLAFSPDGTRVKENIKPKALSPHAQIEIARALATAYLEDLQKNRGVPAGPVLQKINRAIGAKEIFDLFNSFVKDYSKASLNIFDAKIEVEENERREYDWTTPILARATELLKQKWGADRWERDGDFQLYPVAGPNYYKITLFDKAAEVDEFLDTVPGEGAVFCSGDNKADKFLWRLARNTKRIFSVFLGKLEDVAEYPGVLVALRKGKDGQQSVVSGYILKQFLDAHGKKTYRALADAFSRGSIRLTNQRLLGIQKSRARVLSNIRILIAFTHPLKEIIDHITGNMVHPWFKTNFRELTDIHKRFEFHISSSEDVMGEMLRDVAQRKEYKLNEVIIAPIHAGKAAGLRELRDIPGLDFIVNGNKTSVRLYSENKVVGKRSVQILRLGIPDTAYPADRLSQEILIAQLSKQLVFTLCTNSRFEGVLTKEFSLPKGAFKQGIIPASIYADGLVTLCISNSGSIASAFAIGDNTYDFSMHFETNEKKIAAEALLKGVMYNAEITGVALIPGTLPFEIGIVRDAQGLIDVEATLRASAVDRVFTQADLGRPITERLTDMCQGWLQKSGESVSMYRPSLAIDVNMQRHKGNLESYVSSIKEKLPLTAVKLHSIASVDDLPVATIQKLIKDGYEVYIDLSSVKELAALQGMLKHLKTLPKEMVFIGLSYDAADLVQEAARSRFHVRFTYGSVEAIPLDLDRSLIWLTVSLDNTSTLDSLETLLRKAVISRVGCVVIAGFDEAQKLQDLSNELIDVRKHVANLVDVFSAPDPEKMDELLRKACLDGWNFNALIKDKRREYDAGAVMELARVLSAVKRTGESGQDDMLSAMDSMLHRTQDPRLAGKEFDIVNVALLRYQQRIKALIKLNRPEKAGQVYQVFIAYLNGVAAKALQQKLMPLPKGAGIETAQIMRLMRQKITDLPDSVALEDIVNTVALYLEKIPDLLIENTPLTPLETAVYEAMEAAG